MITDEFILDTPTVRDFIRAVQECIARNDHPAGAIEEIQPVFAELLADDDWLPAQYREPAPKSGMGAGIGQWLLFRSADRDLSLSVLVLPPGTETPVHDHLAWGIVGLYQGEQEETVFARHDETVPVGDSEELTLTTNRPLRPGNFYPLLPPTDDIHLVRTTSDITSVSLHLLVNDIGCVWRHTYEPETGDVSPFRSGYVNRACEDEGD